MTSGTVVGAVAVAMILGACDGRGDVPTPKDNVPVPTEETARGEGVAPPSGNRPDAGSGRGMPMSGGMGEMQGRMMGGGSPEDAPEANAAEASTAGCPDVTQELADRGREVYAGAGNCFTCHGGDAAGSPLAPDLTDGEWLNVDGTYGSILAVVREGVAQPQQFPAPMPAMGGANLSENQLCAVAAYVYSLSH